MKVQIVRVGHHASLEHEVNKLLDLGWQLHGPMQHHVCWALGPGGVPNGKVMNELYVQAMVKP